MEESSSSTSKRVWGNLNPLDIPGIVSLVIDGIDSVEDLKNVRVLNKLWLKEAMTKWRGRAVLLINDETFPVILEAFKENEASEEITEAQRAEVEKDPFRFQSLPFKHYRFAKSQAWTYPLEEREACFPDRKLIWNCINLNAIYVDVGESKLKGYVGILQKPTYLPGLKWILSYSSKVKELALSPLKSNQVKNLISFDDVDFSESEDGEIFEAKLGSRSVSVGGRKCQLGYHIEYIYAENQDEFEENLGIVPDWIKDQFKAPQITKLIMSTPPHVCDKNVLKPLFDDEFGATAGGIFCLFPNLKHLKLPSGDAEVAIMAALKVTNEAEPGGIRLLSIDGISLGRQTFYFSQMLLKYLESFTNPPPPLREIKMPVILEDIVKPNGFPVKVFKAVQDGLAKLELEIDCETFYYGNLPMEVELFFDGCSFPNLTHFRVQLDYDTFIGKLPVFNFRDLKRMSKLEEFYFGSKTSVEKSWVTRKLDFQAEDFELADLKRFHFHGNFKKEALEELGRMAKNLQSLEMVFDKENVTAVKEIWPRLRNLRILPCSKVPKREMTAMKESLNVLDESKNYTPAGHCFRHFRASRPGEPC